MTRDAQGYPNPPEGDLEADRAQCAGGEGYSAGSPGARGPRPHAEHPGLGHGTQESESYGVYLLFPIYRRARPEQRSETVTFWLDHRLIPEPCVAERRSYELVYLARAPDRRICGATTVSLGRRAQDGRSVYDLRLFVAPPHRASGLARELGLRSRDLLRADSRDHPAAGLRLAPESLKLGRPGIRRYLERHGFAHRGHNSRGMDIWFAGFE